MRKDRDFKEKELRDFRSSATAALDSASYFANNPLDLEDEEEEAVGAGDEPTPARRQRHPVVQNISVTESVRQTMLKIKENGVDEVIPLQKLEIDANRSISYSMIKGLARWLRGCGGLSIEHRLVVMKKAEDDGTYTVVEGNHRVFALQGLWQQKQQNPDNTVLQRMSFNCPCIVLPAGLLSHAEIIAITHRKCAHIPCTLANSHACLHCRLLGDQPARHSYGHVQPVQHATALLPRVQAHRSQGLHQGVL